MRYIKVKVSPGELGFVCKMITEYEGKIEIGSPLYLCSDGTVTPVENRNIVVGNYDVSNQDEVGNMDYHIKTRLLNERIASFTHYQDRDECFEILDNIYKVGIDKEDTTT